MLFIIVTALHQISLEESVHVCGQNCMLNIVSKTYIIENTLTLVDIDETHVSIKHTFEAPIPIANNYLIRISRQGWKLHSNSHILALHRIAQHSQTNMHTPFLSPPSESQGIL